MIVKKLIEKYIVEKNDKPVNVNQLLDFASLCYLNGVLTISDYRSLSKELMLRGATKPEYYSTNDEREEYYIS